MQFLGKMTLVICGLLASTAQAFQEQHEEGISAEALSEMLPWPREPGLLRPLNPDGMTRSDGLEPPVTHHNQFPVDSSLPQRLPCETSDHLSCVTRWEDEKSDIQRERERREDRRFQRELEEFRAR
ncbi:hypothetical protein [Enterobacter sp. ENT03]|uniref:hypothetical protein n=1 Tax=Enterobacter sp. ENT03 TaxID=2854780 RepID=UPI001C43AD85|nr:hypothetical protein [Enterobacter sp. ENT03]MBV7404709.1 hypothetical protein [Enterobacter sp. ENT03]